MIRRNLTFEPQVFSGCDDSLLQAIGEDLSKTNMDERVVRSVSLANDEEYSNFQLFGIGKPTQKQIVRREKRKVKRAKVKEEFKNLNFGQKLLNLSQKFNPAAAIPRSSALVGVRFNVFGIATKLYPALISEEELKSRNFNLDNAEKARGAWEKVKKIWIGLGGATPALEQAIKNGYDKPVFKTKKAKARKESEKAKFEGDDEYSDYTGAEEAAAYISLGLTVLGAVSAAISKQGANKNPYNAGSPQAATVDVAAMESPELTSEQKAELDRIAAVAAEDIKKGKGLDAGDNDSDDKILGMSKPVFWVGISVIGLSAIGLTIWLIKKNK